MSTEKMQELQDEMKVLKNEIKEVLLDIREHLLDHPETPLAVASVAPQAKVLELERPEAPSPTEPERGQGRVEEGPVRSSLALAEDLRLASPAKGQNGNGHNGNGNGHDDGRGHNGNGNGHNGNGKGHEGLGHNGSPNLLTMAALPQWFGSSMTRIGQEKTKAIIELYEMMEHLPPSFKDVFLRLVCLEGGQSPAMESLLELDALLSHKRSGNGELALPMSLAQ